ncbi:unnamed protein product [Pylaiella littoralis]
MSTETDLVNDDAPSQEEILAGKQDPGVKYLREIKLSAEEKANYESQARSWIPALVEYESSNEGWRLVSSMFRVKVWSTPKADDSGSSLVVCRGQVSLTLDVSLELLQTQFITVFNTSETLAEQMRASDPMSRETKILYQVPCQENEFIRIVWGSFRAAGVAWARDFCFLQHACMTTDPSTGERLFAVVAKSIERPEVPDMEKLCKRIRSTANMSGFVFREPKGGGPIRATYVVNVNPNGWIPNKVVNIICNKQATNVTRVKSKMSDTAKALTALKMEAPIFPKAVGWRQNFEFPVPRPAAGAAAANVSLKFYSTSKVSFRVRGTEAATDWTTPEASKGICGGAWVTYPAQTPVTVAFKVQPETATAAGPTVSAAATGGGVVAPAAGVRASGVVLEWKGAEWFQGFVVFYLVKVA